VCSPDTGATVSQFIDTAGTRGLSSVDSRDGAVSATIGCGTEPYQACTGTLLLTTLEHLSGHKITAVSATKKPKDVAERGARQDDLQHHRRHNYSGVV
jgi:hypothetical protein